MMVWLRRKVRPPDGWVPRFTVRAIVESTGAGSAAVRGRAVRKKIVRAKYLMPNNQHRGMELEFS